MRTSYVLSLAVLLGFSERASAQGNDDCAQVTPVALPSGGSITLTGDNSTANGIGDFVATSPYAGAPVYWVAFTTQGCGDVTITYCGQNPAWTNTFGILANSCPADELVSASSFNDLDCGDGNRTYFFDNLPAGTWSLPVLNDPGNNSSGVFSIDVSHSPCPENNDLCAGLVPQVLPSGGSLTFTGDNSTAGGTNDFDPNSPYFGAPVAWHAFTTTGCNNVTIAYCGQAPAWTNVLGILATDCPALNLVNTSNLNVAECGDGNTTFHYDALPEGTYFLPVLNDPGNGSSGPYSISVSAAACPENNDLCSGLTAQTLASGASLTFSGDNSTAGSTNDFDPNSPYSGAPVAWHAFTTSACNDVTISYCGQAPVWSNVLGILATDCPALNLVNTSSLNVTECGDGNTTFHYDALPAGTYFLPVLNDPNNNSSGAYSITVSASACAVNNDLCFGLVAEPLPIGGTVTFTGDNSNATGINDFDPNSPFAGAPVKWHRFNNPGCATISISYCGQNPVWGNVLGILATDCPALNTIFFTSVDQTTCVDGNYTYTWSQLSAGDYFIPVLLDASQNATGPYSITVSSLACPDNNDFCSLVTPQALPAGGTLVFSGDNTNATGSGDFAPTSPFLGAPVLWHSFTTTECNDVTVSFCGQSPAWGTTFGFLATDCPADSVVFFSTFDQDSCGDGNTTYYYLALDPGTYAVPVVLDPGGNSVGAYNVTVGATACVSTSITTSVGHDLSIYPNPANGSFMFRSAIALYEARLELFDQAGRAVWSRSGVNVIAGTPLVIDPHAALEPGAYVLRVTSDGVQDRLPVLIH